MEIEEQVAQLVATYTDPNASVPWLLCDQHSVDAVALVVVDEDGVTSEMTYGELRERSERVAGALRGLGVGPGDRIASLMEKGIDLVVWMLGAWRAGAVYVPLFTAFGPQAIAARLADTATTVVLADDAQAAKLVAAQAEDASSWVAVSTGSAPGLRRLEDLLAAAEPYTDTTPRGGSWPLVHMLTSGTTGRPKGVVHPVSYLAGWRAYQEFGLGVTDGDRYWSAEHIEVLAAAPTVFRAMRRADPRPKGLTLRCVSSAGEPLTPDVNEWAGDALGVEVRDHFGQTEIGMPLGNAQHPDLARAVKPGSMGAELPGWSVVVLDQEADREVGADVPGRIAVDTTASPFMTFEGYEPAASDRFVGDGRYYLTGDAGRVDEDGDFFFSSRDDDVIIMAGYRIGPLDIESVLVQHDAVEECAVIAVPDEVRGEVVQAIVVLAAGHVADDELTRELQQHVKERYAAHAYPRSVRYVDRLPRTPSGKLKRVELRQQAQPAADSGAA